MNQFAHQGDIQWFKIDKVPSEARKVNKKFISTSEHSASFHALFGDYDMYDLYNSFIIETKEDCILNHSISNNLVNNILMFDKAEILEKKDHRHTIIPKGIFRVGIQQRFDPRENHLLAVRD
ncbi:hypothetical protein [Sphingobacterium sp. 1.A.4]|uniref:hypothetical protein n=1 Tax=Sphingobacterium sp. 1.A.4 TaxID=2044603 RepID=UPI000C0BCB60|nr:hypothetical protein [Sphingobacterium sp. 1.A.4]